MPLSPFTLQKRLEKAREFYSMGEPWSRNLAWKILKEIALEMPGNYKEVEMGIAVAVEEENMREAFRLLGSAAKKSIEDARFARKQRYNVGK